MQVDQINSVNVTFVIIISLIAGLLQIIAYLVYSRKIKIGHIKPNTASWSIWAFGSVLESISYMGVTQDWVKNILPAVCALSAIVLFAYCLNFGHFKMPSQFEWFIVALDFVAISIWWWFGSAVYANVFLVVTAIISFIPIILHVWDDPSVENALPWWLWSIAYALLGIVVLLRWEKWEDLLYPLVFLVLHLLIGILSIDKIGAKIKLKTKSSIN